MKRSIYILWLAFVMLFLTACDSEPPDKVRRIVADLEAVYELTQEQLPEEVDGPLVDSLVATFKGMSVAIKHDREDVFRAFLDPDAEGQLQMATKQFGYTSLKTFLANQFGVWPDPDTLLVTGLVVEDAYARLTFLGYGRSVARKDYRYTFALFRRTDKGWRLSALSWLEKPPVDKYGYPIGYHETELPPKLRFPRFF